MAILLAGAGLSCWGLAADPFVPDGDAPPAAWDTYGGDPGGQHYSTLQEIAPHNVHSLAVAKTTSPRLPRLGHADSRGSNAAPVFAFQPCDRAGA